MSRHHRTGLATLSVLALAAGPAQAAELNLYPLALPFGSLSLNVMHPVAEHHHLGGLGRLQSQTDHQEAFGFYALGARYEYRPQGLASGPYAAAQLAISHATLEDQPQAWFNKDPDDPGLEVDCRYQRSLSVQNLQPLVAAGFRWQWPQQLHSQLGVTLTLPLEIGRSESIRGRSGNDASCSDLDSDDIYIANVQTKTTGAYLDLDGRRLVGLEWSIGYGF